MTRLHLANLGYISVIIIIIIIIIMNCDECCICIAMITMEYQITNNVHKLELTEVFGCITRSQIMADKIGIARQTQP